MNLDIGDEGVGKHGAVSWMLAVDDRWSPYGSDTLGRSRRNLEWDWLVLVVRDLRSAVPSVILENRHAAPSLAYRRKHIWRQFGIDIAACPNELTAALRSIICWVRIIAGQSPDISFRIEDQQRELRKFVTDKIYAPLSNSIPEVPIQDNAEKLYDGLKHEKPNVATFDWCYLSKELKFEVEWYCKTFGYGTPFEDET